MSLYGHEISDTITVWEANLGRFAKMEKGDFIGRDALKKIADGGGTERVLVGLEMVERGIGRDGYAVLSADGKRVGEVTSGSPGPFVQKNIALAYVPRQLSAVGTELAVEVRQQPVKAVVVPTPFYKRPKKAAAQPVGAAQASRSGE